MVQRVAFIHTVGFLVDVFRTRMREALPHVDCFHILNESLLQDLLRGEAKTAVYRRVVGQVLAAADAGADLIVMTCSSTSPAVDLVRPLLDRPVLKIDDPLMMAAVRTGRHIGLVCTAISTLEPSSALLRFHAMAQSCDVTITPVLLTDAYTALMAGDRASHDKIVRDAVASIADTVDVIVLAQASLAHLTDVFATTLSIPVLASPSLLMDAVAQHCATL